MWFGEEVGLFVSDVGLGGVNYARARAFVDSKVFDVDAFGATSRAIAEYHAIAPMSSMRSFVGSAGLRVRGKRLGWVLRAMCYYAASVRKHCTLFAGVCYFDILGLGGRVAYGGLELRSPLGKVFAKLDGGA